MVGTEQDPSTPPQPCACEAKNQGLYHPLIPPPHTFIPRPHLSIGIILACLRTYLRTYVPINLSYRGKSLLNNDPQRLKLSESI